MSGENRSLAAEIKTMLLSNYMCRTITNDPDRIVEAIKTCLDKLNGIDWKEEVVPLLTERVCSCCEFEFIPYLDKTGQCEFCRMYQDKAGWNGFVSDDLKRARRLGLSATLTTDEWMGTIKYFRHRCAYCQRNIRFTTLEHFIPLCHGGGTTAHNCVPSCVECNRKKHRYHPDKVKKIPREDLERVRQYLETRRRV